MQAGQDEVILLAHGDGGTLTQELIQGIFSIYLSNPFLDQMGDSALLDAPGGRLALSTDSFVVSPLFFPGGDIGKLAICGTVNDLAVSGARPLYLTAAFIIEEGLPLATLERVVLSMAATAREAGVLVVAGDTKVVGRGQADRLFINTTGIGQLLPGIDLGYELVQPGDKILVSGSLGEHGLAILAQRQELGLEGAPPSDCQPLSGLIATLLEACPGVKLLRDPTRGGLATTLKELAEASRMDFWLEETSIPVRPEVRALAEILGLDPLYLANEGKFVAVVAEEAAERALSCLRALPAGANAALIGEALPGRGQVILKTPFGGSKRLERLTGQPLPRIC